MHTYTIREAREIERDYATTPNAELAARYGVNKQSILNYAQRNGLKKTVGFGQFKKGHTPWIAGRKGYCNSPRTTFKPGNQPANTLHDGALRQRADHGGKVYWFVRVAKGQWKRLHHLNWEAANGPVPVGYVLRCIDGDTLNADASNWEAITRAENCRRNENRPKAAKAVKKLWDKVRTLDAHGMKHDYKWRSRYAPKAA